MTYDDISYIQVNDMDGDDRCTRKIRKTEEEKHEATRLRVKKYRENIAKDPEKVANSREKDQERKFETAASFKALQTDTSFAETYSEKDLCAQLPAHEKSRGNGGESRKL